MKTAASMISWAVKTKVWKRLTLQVRDKTDQAMKAPPPQTASFCDVEVSVGGCKVDPGQRHHKNKPMIITKKLMMRETGSRPPLRNGRMVTSSVITRTVALASLGLAICSGVSTILR